MNKPVITFGESGMVGRIISFQPPTITREACHKEMCHKETAKLFDRGEITITMWFVKPESRLAKRRKQNARRRSLVKRRMT